MDAATDSPSTPSDAATDWVIDQSTSDAGCGSSYDPIVLCDKPVAYWTMSGTTIEPDRTGHGIDGTFKGGAPMTASMPNGDLAARFDGKTQYLTIPSSPSLSVPATGELTWEGWIRPDVLQYPTDYVDWMGKCDQYAPTCEWEARMYSTTNPQMRCNRLSAYIFNPTAGLGSAADFQPVCGLVQAGQWLHVVGEYTTKTQPATCTQTQMYPGSIDIWVDGVKWNQAAHDPTGCMSQYKVVPTASGSALEIGTMARDTFFPGAIGKVAIYSRLLTQAEITRHYVAMTGKMPSGTCANTCTF
jgi:hypothetical protein